MSKWSSGYYGNGFDDYLKQVATVYPDLDLFQVVIDDIVLPTPSGADTTIDEADASVHTVEEEVNEPAETEALDQNAPEDRNVPNSLLALEGSFAPKGLFAFD